MASTRISVAIVLMVFLLPAISGAAETQTFPRIEGAVPIEIQDDWNYDSDSADNEHNQLSTLTEPEVTVWFAPGFSLFAHAVLQSVKDPDPGDDRYFEDHGLFVEDLFLRYQTGRFAVRGGKLTPKFGRGWEETPGVYGTDFGEAGYEFAERIGIEGSATFELAGGGTHTLSASTFFLDTSVLAHSTLKGRGTLGRADGGVSNTEDFSSFALTLDGADFAGVEGMRYHAAYISQRRGVGNDADETGVAFALSHSLALTRDLTLTPFVEFIHFDDAEGVDNQDRNFITVAGHLDWRNWNLALALVGRETDNADGTETDDFMFQASVGYGFDCGLGVDVGWKIANEANIEVRTLGVLFAYAVEF